MKVDLELLKLIKLILIFLNEGDFNIDDYDYLTNVSAGIIKFSDAYHNSWLSCETVSFLRASIISKEHLASPYSQVKQLYNQEASDPNLEQNLENNKFHIIEKTTTSGSKINKTIYKNEN